MQSIAKLHMKRDAFSTPLLVIVVVVLFRSIFFWNSSSFDLQCHLLLFPSLPTLNPLGSGRVSESGSSFLLPVYCSLFWILELVLGSFIVIFQSESCSETMTRKGKTRNSFHVFFPKDVESLGERKPFNLIFISPSLVIVDDDDWGRRDICVNLSRRHFFFLSKKNTLSFPLGWLKMKLHSSG